ncbi:hypothetical protein [Flavobacterium sp.]
MRTLSLKLVLCQLALGLSGQLFAQTPLPTCSSNTIHVAPKLVLEDFANRAAWETKFHYMVLCDQTTATDIVVDLGQFEDRVPEWLRENSAYINFEDSYKSIHDIHLLQNVYGHDDTILIDAADEAFKKDIKTYYYSDLIVYFDDYYTIDKIAQCEYYKNYKSIGWTMFNNIKVNAVSEFDENKFCFSAALLKSIIKEHVTVPNAKEHYDECRFDFTIVNLDGIEKGVMKFTYEGAANPTSSYYDFSDEPGRAKFAEIIMKKATEKADFTPHKADKDKILADAKKKILKEKIKSSL